MDDTGRRTFSGLTRREWIGAAATSAFGVLAANQPLHANCPKGETVADGTILTYTPNNHEDQAELIGLGVLDLKSGTWSKLTSDGSPVARLSPDGQTVAYAKFAPPGRPNADGVWLVYVNEKNEPTRVFEQVARPSWSADGRRLLVSRATQVGAIVTQIESWILDIERKQPERLPHLDADLVLAWSPNGQQVIVTSKRDPVFASKPSQYWPVELVNIDGSDRKRIVEDGMPGAGKYRFSADGRTVLYTQFDEKNRPASLRSIGVDGTDRRCVFRAEDHESIESFCVSPDGKSLAVNFAKFVPSNDGEPDRQVRVERWAIVDMHGQPQHALTLPHTRAQLLDWRYASR